MSEFITIQSPIIKPSNSLEYLFEKTLTITEGIDPMHTKRDYLKKIINVNEYVKNCVSNKKKDDNSLSSLIERSLSQSDCIKLGTGIEKILKDIILDQNKKIIDIKPKNDKGKKERDHLFVDEQDKIVYYAELKSNLFLDTEKCKSTASKCIEIQKELEILHPGYTIKMHLVGLRYYEKDEIPKIVASKYYLIKDNLVGIKEYLTELTHNFSFENAIEYKAFLNELANAMFDTLVDD